MMKNSTKDHKQNLEWMMEGWRSIELRVHAALTNNSNQADQNYPGRLDYDTHYIETASGQRLCVETYSTPDGMRGFESYYSDGDRSAAALGNGAGRVPDQVEIGHSFGRESQTGSHECPIPLFFFHVGKKPLHRALEDAEYRGHDRHLGRDCDVFVFPRIGGVIPEYFLDRQTSIPLKVNSYLDKSLMEMRRPDTSWEATKVDTVEGRPFPVRSKLAHFNRERPYDQFAERTISVEAVHFDRDYPASMFWPEIHPNTHVFDLTRQTTAQEGIHAAMHPPRDLDARASLPTVRVSQPTIWADYLPMASLGLGSAIVAVSLFMFWKRRT